MVEDGLRDEPGPAMLRKHLENIFNRTGVRTRSGAAALALPSVSPFAQLLPPKNRR